MSSMSDPILPAALESPVLVGPAAHARFADYLELTKPRLSLLSVLTALVGYLAAPRAELGWKFTAVLIGTACAAGGVAALNQWMEVDTDARMRRTRDRPLPSGRVTTGAAFVIGWALCAAGLALLYAQVNGLSAAMALATIVTYLAIYTPAKRWSHWSTEIGAVAGALPPLIGWTGAEGRISGLGLVLAGVLFLWQIPHFLAIAWMYRDDYSAVAFPLLAVRDPRGGRVAAWSAAAALLLVVVTLLPVARGDCGGWYGAAAIGLGGWLAWKAGDFLRRERREAAARRLFLATILYLPILLAVLVVDRLGLI
jgi:heme o synthase